MNAQTARWMFALLCALGLLAIVFGLWLEAARVRRGDTVISARQYRWRLISGVLWCFILGSFIYATAFQWPQSRADVATAKRFFAIISGGFMLMMVALFLLAFDVWQTGRERRASQRKFDREVNELALHELEKARLEQLEKSASESDSPS